MELTDEQDCQSEGEQQPCANRAMGSGAAQQGAASGSLGFEQSNESRVDQNRRESVAPVIREEHGVR
jgi:hypothetical protein